MAQDGTAPAGLYGGEPSRLVGIGVVADRVNAAVARHQQPGGDPSIDLLIAESERQELAAADDAVGHVAKTSRIDVNATCAAISPRATAPGMPWAAAAPGAGRARRARRG